MKSISSIIRFSLQYILYFVQLLIHNVNNLGSTKTFTLLVMSTALPFRYFDNPVRKLALVFHLTYLASFQIGCQRHSSKPDNSRSIGMSILNVAEKNDAAKHLAGFLSRGNSQRVSPIICCFLIYYIFGYHLNLITPYNATTLLMLLILIVDFNLPHFDCPVLTSPTDPSYLEKLADYGFSLDY